jgi:predicted outer membrane repeat protein
VYDRLDVTDTGEGHVDIGVFEAPPTRLYVDEGSSGASTGLDWANAFADLQAAMVWGASGPMTIWVAEGTYIPGDQRSDSFMLQSEIAVYGGFPSGGGSGGFGARSPGEYESILSGDIGVIGESSDNVSSVVTSPGVDATAVLDGFTVTGANGGTGGGGWYNFYGDPTIRNVRFVRNRATTGAGMRNNQGSPTLTNVWFLGNVATEDGGGYLGYGSQSEATFANVVFCGNVAQNQGGGFMSDTGSESLVNVTFASNSALYGGGVAATGALVTVDNAVFWGNGGAWGSQIWSEDLKVQVTYSLIAAGCPATYATCSGNIVVANPLFDRDPAPGGDGTWGSVDDEYGALGIAPRSPAADAGDNDAVPQDVHDIDTDGNVTEKLPLDIFRNQRFIDSASAPDTGNGTVPLVDMGASEALCRVYLPLILRNY